MSPTLYLALFPRYSVVKSSKTTPPQFEPPINGTQSNFVIKLGRQRDKALGYILVKLHDSNFIRFVTIHSRHRQTTDRQTSYEIAELAKIDILYVSTQD